MANRSYLFVKTKDDECKGLSECAYEIPLSHILLVSGDTQKVTSRVFDSDLPWAIEGDFDQGYKKLFDFLEQCKSKDIISTEQYEQMITEAHAALDQYLNTGARVLLEPVEIFEMEDPEDFEEFDSSAYDEDDELADAFFAFMVDDVINTMIKPSSGYIKDSLAQLQVFKDQGQIDAIDEALGLEWDEVLFYDPS